MLFAALLAGGLAAWANGNTARADEPRPNVLFITVDDMNWDSVAAYGCPVENITPNK